MLQHMFMAPRAQPVGGPARGMVLCRGRSSRVLEELFSIQDERTPKGQTRIKPETVKPAQPVPDHITKPPWYHGKPVPSGALPEVHDAAGMEKMRAAGRLAAHVLTEAGKLVAPGVATEAIDAAVHELTVAAGAYPSPLRYGSPPFPKSVCTSVNEVICHGIPDVRKLREGDIINIDVTVWLDGYHGDTSRMFFVGEVSPEARELCAATKGALDAAVAICAPGVEFRRIGDAVDSYVRAHAPHLTINEDFIGHGVGRNFHAAPHVFPFKNNDREGKMVEGQTFTIEPILHVGSPRYRLWKDHWTAVARDGSLSAQYEHTLLITPGGVEVLTAYE